MSLQPYSYSRNHKTQTPIGFVANTHQVVLFSKDNLEVLWGKEIAYNSFFSFPRLSYQQLSFQLKQTHTINHFATNKTVNLLHCFNTFFTKTKAQPGSDTIRSENGSI